MVSAGGVPHAFWIVAAGGSAGASGRYHGADFRSDLHAERGAVCLLHGLPWRVGAFEAGAHLFDSLLPVALRWWGRWWSLCGCYRPSCLPRLYRIPNWTHCLRSSSRGSSVPRPAVLVVRTQVGGHRVPYLAWPHAGTGLLQTDHRHSPNAARHGPIPVLPLSNRCRAFDGADRAAEPQASSTAHKPVQAHADCFRNRPLRVVFRAL